MIRYGFRFGSLDCPVRVIPLLGASGTPANEDTRNKMMKCEGVCKKVIKQ